MRRAVTTKEFIEWYFKIEDAKWVLKELKFNLYNSGKYSLDLYELFETAHLSLPILLLGITIEKS